MEFIVTTVIAAPVSAIFEAWLNSEGHTAMTGAEATIAGRGVGQTFTAWDGYIWGETLFVREGDYIKQRWRTSDFEEGQDDSIIEVWLKPLPDGTTSLKLKHSELREADEHYKKGWDDFYFTPMKAYFGQ